MGALSYASAGGTGERRRLGGWPGGVLAASRERRRGTPASQPARTPALHSPRQSAVKLKTVAAKAGLYTLLALVQVLPAISRQVGVLAHSTAAPAAAAPAAACGVALGLGRGRHGRGGRCFLGRNAVGELLFIDEPHPLRILFLLRRRSGRAALLALALRLLLARG